MSEPTASSTAVTMSSSTLTLERRGTPCGRSRCVRSALAIFAHGWTSAPERLQLVGQRLGPPAARVHHDQHRARRQVGGGDGDHRHGVLARLRGRLEHDDALVGEQRRAQQLGEFVGADLAGPHPVDRDVARWWTRRACARRAARRPWRARRAVPRHPGRDVTAISLTPTMVSRGADRPRATYRTARRSSTPPGALPSTASTGVAAARNQRHRHSRTERPPRPRPPPPRRPPPPGPARSPRARRRPAGHAQHPPQLRPGEPDQQLRAGRPQQAEPGRRAAQHGDRCDHRRDREVRAHRDEADPAGHARPPAERSLRARRRPPRRPSASGFGQPRRTSRRDQPGAMTTSAAVAERTARSRRRPPAAGATASRISTVADKAGIACRAPRTTARPPARWRPSRRRAARSPSAARPRRTRPAPPRPAPPRSAGPISPRRRTAPPRTRS